MNEGCDKIPVSSEFEKTNALEVVERFEKNDNTFWDALCDNYHLMDYLPVGICIFDRHYVIRFWNRCLAHWTRIASDDILGCSLIERYPSLSTPGFMARVQNIFSGGPPILLSSQLHRSIIPCKMTDGELMIQKAVVSAIPAKDASRYRALMAIENVTELSRKVAQYRMLRNQAMDEVARRKEIEEALRNTNASLREHQHEKIEKERLKVLLEMAGATAHELNQPLMTLLGSIELVHLLHDIPDELARHLENIEKSAKRIAGIVGKIQKMKKYQTKRYMNDTSIIDLDESAL